METCQISICNTTVRISSDDRKFSSYVRAHFEPVLDDAGSEPDVRISFVRSKQAPSPVSIADCEVVCRGVYSCGKHVIWNEIPFLQGLTLRFTANGETLEVEALYCAPSSISGAAKRIALSLLGRNSRRSSKSFFFEIMYNLVYYPLFWALGSRGIFPMHAGAVVYKGRAIVVAGAQGTGKSTLIAELLRSGQSSFLSDNILLHDGERIYPCHEPLRLSLEMLARMPRLESILSQLDIPVPLGRRAFNVRRDFYAKEAKPDFFVIPRLTGRRSEVTEIDRNKVLSRVGSFDTLADEIRSYEVFSSVLEAASFGSDEPRDRRGALESLLSRARCFEFAMKRGEHPADSVSALEKALFGGSGASEP